MCIYVDMFVVASGREEMHELLRTTERTYRNLFSFTKIILQICTICLPSIIFLAVSEEH